MTSDDMEITYDAERHLGPGFAVPSCLLRRSPNTT
jgi:hypothetical protein